MVSKSDLTHSDLLREHDQYVGRSLKVNGSFKRDTYTLRRACKKLSERKRREIAEFIQMIAAPQKRPRKAPEGMVEWRRLD